MRIYNIPLNRISIVLILVGIFNVAAFAASPRDIIPRPAKIVDTKKCFSLPRRTLTYSAPGCETIVDSLLLPFAFTAAKGKKADIQLGIAKLPKDTYTLSIDSKGVKVQGGSQEALFHGVQSLVQLLALARKDSVLQGCSVTDRPVFPYRGMHVDVSRHFRSLPFLKKQVDAMALLKLNRMHLHLTDAAGWRMPIDSYPKLNTIAAWRPQRRWQDWGDNGARYCRQSDPGAYGGYYSKEELRELVRYAAARHIEVVPEIEMPGHSDEVVAVYPELSCNGTGGDLCPGKEATFKFIEDVLTETMDIFPSRLIHIGGDEASKADWSSCPDCRRRMEQEGIRDVHGLQSYLIGRVEKFVNSRGRQIIGWDEILEGGLAPNATVMSWRGTKGGIDAMAAGHDVIMTPGEACYLDYTQDAPFKEPTSIGGYLPLSKVYAYNPLADIPDSVDTRHLLGIQANLWSEYITDDSHAEYMYYPRTFAIAEIGWGNPAERNYPEFKRRSLALMQELQRRGYTTFDLAREFGEHPASLTPVNHLARGAKVIYNGRYDRERYPAAGEATLTDGQRGGWTYQDRKWQGWLRNVDVTIDLAEAKPLHMVSASFMHSPGPGVFLPDSVVVSVSDNGRDFTPVATLRGDIPVSSKTVQIKDFAAPLATTARYVNLRAIRHRKYRAYLFIDEIVIN